MDGALVKYVAEFKSHESQTEFVRWLQDPNAKTSGLTVEFEFPYWMSRELGDTLAHFAGTVQEIPR